MSDITPTRTYKLYKGKVQIDYFDRHGRYSHVYIMHDTGRWITGVSSCTSMLAKPQLIVWAVNLCRDFLLNILNSGGTIASPEILEAADQHVQAKEKGAKTGTLVHEWIKSYIAGEKPSLPSDEKVLNGVNGFLDWVSQHKVKFFASEQLVYSRINDYVGTMDAGAELTLEIKGKKKRVKCPIDYKTNNWNLNEKTKQTEPSVYNEQRYQVASYTAAYIEEHGKKSFTGPRLQLCIDKDTGRFQALMQDEEKGDFAADVACFLALKTLKLRADVLKQRYYERRRELVK